ncbi:MAG TPA: nicotinate-nucleotide--dimethylbenzimidazole phosphoribosyltransferase [Gaiella sp.]|uniref:nicotinate-nucleotide--dimethylbenzimidazole phosphoribosyltransferase n=1 Tax=Gaiella sp. TaxID=2663207 RepID=UPI002D7F3E9F|nr:nicotinate-nucleotide--dimethylbenzimidazole phosphoribosyltransferase [Gaiella sp.]HET9287177.1 nicotinate-nucleotide--dimethylbenzimidazole phosphoribosyltransferase [Gaiella sp.]
MSVDAPLDGPVRGLAPLDPAVERDARAALDAKTKPRRSLGTLEDLATRIASVRGSTRPAPLDPVVVVAAGDHGVAHEDVSAYPQEVTGQMLANFAGGGAAVAVLCRIAGARLVIVDAGVVSPPVVPGLRDLALGRGTANAAAGPAMERRIAVDGVARGAALGRELVDSGAGVVALGEMGIGNTTVAAAVTCALLGCDPAVACGRGTGLDQAGVARKVEVVGRMLAVNAPRADDPLGTLAAVGGFELAVLAGVALGAAGGRAVVLVDGYISSVSALVAARLAPALEGYLVASHRSPEPGHALVLEALRLDPLLDLGLRLGEGSGAALALPLLAAARAILVEMATFAEAGVSDTGR